MKGNGRTPVIVRDMPYGLICAGVFDDTVIGSVMGTETLLRDGNIQSDEIVVPESFDFFDGSFLRKFG